MSETKPKAEKVGSMSPKEWREATEKLIRLTVRSIQLGKDYHPDIGAEQAGSEKKGEQD